MSEKRDKRVTIYDIARQVGIAPSSVSKALNNQPTVSKKIKALVKAKALELNYVHNSSAASLRRGTSKIIGVIVPKINTTFFSDAIAGMEEACFENNHNLIICQSDESFQKETQAVTTLIHQNVDCIIISLSVETRSVTHLQEIMDHHVDLIQFDRVDSSIPCHVVVNDNKNAAYGAVKHLIKSGYQRIAFLGGSDHLAIYKDRKEGYLKAIKEFKLTVPYNYIIDNALTTERAVQVATALLKSGSPPDAFFTITDYAALGVLKAATALGLQVPEDVGIIGFSNETFTEMITPSLSSVDQKSRKLGKDAAGIYFDFILKQNQTSTPKKKVIESSLVIRDSSSKKTKKNAR
jgi:DNA-binding LacI/PurR family transcriptional regulator